MTFRQKLKAERKRLGITQAQAVAVLRDVSRSWYEKAETGKRTPHKWMQYEALRRLRHEPKAVQTGSDQAVDLPRLVRLVAAETASRAEQACRYALKHHDFSDEPTSYQNGWEIRAEVCKGAIVDHVERHIEDIIAKALHSLPNA